MEGASSSSASPPPPSTPTPAASEGMQGEGQREPTLEGIPSELLLKTLGDILLEDDPISITFDGDGHIRLNHSQYVEPLESLGPFTTSTQMYDAATRVFYGQNEFVIPWTPVLASHGIYQFSTAKHLRRLTIESDRAINSPYFGFVPFINALMEGAPDQLREIVISFEEAPRLLTCVYELTNAVAACASGSFDTPTLNFELSITNDGLMWYGSRIHGNSCIKRWVCRTLEMDDSTLHDLKPFSGPYCKQDLLCTNFSPNLQKITIVGPFPHELLDKFEAHTCKVGQCGIEKLPSYRDPNDDDVGPDQATDDRRHYIWKKKDNPDIFPCEDMHQFHALLPKKYREDLAEDFDMLPLSKGGYARRIDDDLPFQHGIYNDDEDDKEDDQVEAPGSPTCYMFNNELRDMDMRRRDYFASRWEARARRANCLIAPVGNKTDSSLVSDNARARPSMPQSPDAETTNFGTIPAPHAW